MIGFEMIIIVLLFGAVLIYGQVILERIINHETISIRTPKPTVSAQTQKSVSIEDGLSVEEKQIVLDQIESDARSTPEEKRTQLDIVSTSSEVMGAEEKAVLLEAQ